MENLLLFDAPVEQIMEQKMTKRTRRKHSVVFKANVALVAMAGYKTLAGTGPEI